jgi:hypothetical protein
LELTGDVYKGEGMHGMLIQKVTKGIDRGYDTRAAVEIGFILEHKLSHGRGFLEKKKGSRSPNYPMTSTIAATSIEDM